MIGELLALDAALLFSYMTLGWLFARRRGRLDTVDSLWGLGFVLTAWAAVLFTDEARNFVIAVLVSIWGVRLSSHIWGRNQGHPDDPRYRELSRKWRGDLWRRAYVSVFLLQGALVLLVGLPAVMAVGNKLNGLGWLTLAGGLVWLAGFSIEAVADRQLRTFIARPNHPKVLQTGLWRYSRHPNYFGELTQWWGLGLIALQASYGWIGLAGPLILTYLIVFVSGLPPIEKRHSNDPEYRQYKSRTSALIPWPPRR
jgi:steroid 5-alpha reductase family enzyme